jgi:putative ABC transport system permease protein
VFFRLLFESFLRQRRRKMLAGIAILLGTTAVTAMLALATTIGDRIHQELAVYGANIVVFPKADSLDVKVGGVDVKPATGGAYLKESDLEKLKGIFWANNITGISPELTLSAVLPGDKGLVSAEAVGLWFKHGFSVSSGPNASTGAPQLHPSWHITGRWPSDDVSGQFNPDSPEAFHGEAVVGLRLAAKLGVKVGDVLLFGLHFPHDDPPFVPLRTDLRVTGIASTGDEFEDKLLLPLDLAQQLGNLPGAVSRIEISAKTRPEDAFARLDPDKMSAKQHDVWYCRPYANSIAFQIREAIPGADAEQVRRVEQSEGTVLERISGLMWLISGAALLAAGFAVSAAMATAVLERRGEIGLMRSLGASKGAIATLFYAESGLLAAVTGTVGYLAGSTLAWWLGAKIFPGDGKEPMLNLVLLPVIVAMALIVAVAGSTPAIRAALSADPAATLRGDA